MKIGINYLIAFAIIVSSCNKQTASPNNQSLLSFWFDSLHDTAMAISIKKENLIMNSYQCYKRIKVIEYQ